MKLSNPWVGYWERGYRQIKTSLINRLKTTAPDVTDHSESNLLIIIISMFSGLVEQLHYYIDSIARESFLGTARKFASVVKLTRPLDYRIKSYLPASVDLYFTYLGINNVAVAITQEGQIPAGTIIKTANGTPFITVKTLVVKVGDSFGVVSAKQQEQVVSQLLGVSTGAANQEHIIPGFYAHNTMELTVDGVNWILKNTLARSLPTDLHYIIDVGEDKIPYIRFGNSINGAKPTANKNIVGTYYVTEGATSNGISPDTINILDSNLVLPTPATQIRILNNLQPIGGSDVESLDDIRTNAPLTIRTLERAVTIQDYKDLVIQADGVAKANVVYVAGKDVDVYIAPNGGGVASQSLLDDTGDYLDNLKMITTRINMKSAGITPVVVKAVVKARFRADKIQAKLDAENILGTTFSFENQDINGRIAMSDVIAVVDGLQRVDTIDIIGLYTLPYPFPQGHNTALNWARETLITSNETAQWRLVYAGVDFRLFYNGAFVANIAINTPYIDPRNLITFNLLASMYSVGQAWEFTSYPFNKTIKVEDNTIPIIVAGQTTNITVI